MREDRALRTEGTRSSALWGRGSKGESRSSALWGRRGGRSAVAFASLAVALVLPVAGLASGSNPSGDDGSAFVPSSLLAAAQAKPDKQFDVIVQGDKDSSSKGVAEAVKANNGQAKRAFRSIVGASASLSGKQIVQLAKQKHISAITPDVSLGTSAYQNSEMWRDTVDLNPLRNTLDPLTGLVTGPAPQAPAIAIVDSGIDAAHVADFGARVVARVNFSSLSPLTAADEEGHGTMVAGIAAGAAAGHEGAATNAPLVDLKTADKNGQSVTSDVIAAVDWIIANKAAYNIRVANFSMSGSTDVSFRNDPLDKAVEKLWFNGIVVVAAAGNHGTGTGAVSMSRAPGNDPFVITVGAVDQNLTADPLDDTVAPWSAYGFTMDGFSKPDMVAPGRYMISPVPDGSTLVTTAPDRITSPGYMWMSGTSFSAPVVAGVAADLLAQHPGWTPDQVKGALMLSANYLPLAGSQSAGVGEIDGGVAASIAAPPNPNENLDVFIKADAATGARVFDDASWASTVAGNASWSSASWASASWASASWSSANWASASWSSANWASQTTQAVSTQVNWTEASWSSAASSQALLKP